MSIFPIDGRAWRIFTLPRSQATVTTLYLRVRLRTVAQHHSPTYLLQEPIHSRIYELMKTLFEAVNDPGNG